MPAVKRWIKRFLLIAATVVVVPVLLLAAGVPISRYISARIAERDFPPPGRLVEIDGRLSHIHCTGKGAPTIVLESGLDDRGSWSWAGIRDELSRISRVCAYDRAGILWSEPGEDPRDAEQVTGELHALLSAASEGPPYVMVGHSLGGLFARVYDQRYPGEVVGFVFVESSHPEQDERFPAEVREKITKARAFSPRRLMFNVLSQYWSLIEHDTPPTAYRWRSFSAVQREAASVDAISEQAGRTGSLGDRPVVVLTAGVPWIPPGISDEGAAAMRRTWLELQEELAALSTNADHRVVAEAGHYVHVDQPDAVVAAIHDVVTAVREGGSVRRRGSGADTR